MKKNKFKTGDYITTQRGYFGIYYSCSLDGKTSYVSLYGCTYSDESWYDKVPTEDIKKATLKDKTKWL